MNNYQCEKCELTIESRSNPSTLNCPEGSFHRWHNLGPVGRTNYQCKKCGTHLKADRSPSTLGCPRGSFHQWNRL